MKSYIINLERSTDRKSYMEVLCKKLPFWDVEFVKAVDGRNMSANEQEHIFDKRKFKKRYSIDVRPGEIGCTLSHQKCFRKIVEDNEPYVLILEDDIQKPIHDIGVILNSIEEMMVTETPRIILLSGWYWFKRTHDFMGSYRLADVYDAFLTHSYVINQAAARLLIEERPFITADDWRYIRQKGVQLQAVYPHLIDQNWDGDLATMVNVEPIKKRSVGWYCRNACRLTNLKILKIIGHFEKA